MSSTSFDVLRLGLGLGLGHQDGSPEQYCKIKNDEEHSSRQKKKEEDPCNHHHRKAYPSLTLGPVPYDDNEVAIKSTSDHSNSPSALSNSFSNSCSIIKRERSDTQEFELDDQVEEKMMNPSISRVTVDVDHDESGNPSSCSSSSRKKLRLTKEQSAVLEDSFKDHSTLNPKQKQELARKLNLRARQVEVWFQNRRARTKLKQTEVECEVLKKCCENLTEENKRLQKELQELKAMKTVTTRSSSSTAAGGALYVQLPVASLMICPSCERINGGSSSSGGPSPETIGSKSTVIIHPHFYKTNYPFTHSSAAC